MPRRREIKVCRTVLMVARNYALPLQVHVCGLTYSTNTPSTPETGDYEEAWRC